MATSRHHAGAEFEQILMTLAPEVARAEHQPSSGLEFNLAVLERERREFHLELLEAAHVQRRLSGPEPKLRRGHLAPDAETERKPTVVSQCC